jgi:dipeptidyl aminopeptidase/acylaminoacyl peptidase
VLQGSQQPGGIATAFRFWDVPLDGSPPRQLLSYNRGQQLLTDFDYFAFSRQLSPDGRQLVLADPVDVAGTGLLVVDLVAGTTRKIATAGAAGNAAWSPDGQRIAFRGFTVAGPLQKESGIWVVSATGGAPQQVWMSDRSAGSGATTIYGWTEDGAGIAFTRDYTEVSVVDVTTKQVRRVAGVIHGITWRPARPSVAIVVEDEATAPSPSGPHGAPGSVGRPGHVEVRDTTVAAPRIIYRHDDVGTLLWDPRWSPTSDEVLLHWVCGAGATERDELVVVDAVSGARRSLPITGCVSSVAWSSDGSKILYSGLDSVRVRNADGSNDRELFRPGLPPGAFQENVGAVTAFAPR